MIWLFDIVYFCFFPENSGRKGEFYGGNVSVPPYTTEYAVDTTENWDDGTSVYLYFRYWC